jgi:hypothetical protein
MTISRESWNKFINRLSAISTKAADELRRFIDSRGGLDAIDRYALIDFAYGLSTKYGEAAGALAAEMYDAVALASDVALPSALPAETASIGEVAKAINGTLKTGNAEIVASSVYRLVKMTGVDTTMQNALRDGAEWAWIPSGDTCAFCITLASRGWQKASKAALKGGHAEHIHANCDCTYAVRFDPYTSVEGYEPEKYYEMYRDAPGYDSQDKINAMRRAFYKENSEKINEQKRIAYAKRKERESSKSEEYNVNQ